MQQTQRINVVDGLRGFAVAGIIIIHFLEHLNFYSFPEPTPFEQGLWDTVFYLGANKMYAIFALLFGFSCYVQHANRERRGEDFRPRFAWRMLLLFGWGLLDLVFFNGDILCTYAVLGLLLIPLVRAKDWVLILIALILLLQPIELFYLIAGLLHPEVQPMDLGLGNLWGLLYTPCAEGGFVDVAKTNLSNGLQLNFGYALEHGRLTQTLMLFVVGMLMGRKGRFLAPATAATAATQNAPTTIVPFYKRFWPMVVLTAVLAFCSTQNLLLLLDFKTMPTAVGQSLETMLTAWRNASMTALYVAAIYHLYYYTRARKAFDHLAIIGRMSLTDYLLQSAVGAFLFYNWGLALHTVSSHGISFLLALVFLACLYVFCRFWTKYHRRGPLEELWARATNFRF